MSNQGSNSSTAAIAIFGAADEHKPTLLLLHGWWHTSEHMETLSLRLQDFGFKTVVPDLEFGNSDAPCPNIKAAIDPIKDLLKALLEKDNVVILTHSFSSVVASSAICGFTSVNSSNLPTDCTNRVLGMIHMAGILHPPNWSGLVPSIVLPCMDKPDGYYHLFTATPEEYFYNSLLSAQEKKYWAARLGYLSTACLHGNSARDGVLPGYLDVPNWYVKCLYDRVITPDIQSEMAKRLVPFGADIIMTAVQSDHSPYLSRVPEMVDLIKEAIKEFVGAGGRPAKLTKERYRKT